MRKKGMVWFTFLLLLASFIPNLMQAYVVNAQSSDEVRETIVKTEHLNVSTIVKQVDEQLNWEVKYRLTTSDANTVQRLKFKFFDGDATKDENLIFPEEVTGWGYSQDHWFMPEEMTSSSEGSLFLTTDLSVEKLNLRLQTDEEVTREVEITKTVEVDQDAAQTLAADTDESIPQVEEVTELVEEKIVTENTLETPYSDTHQLSAPKVTLPDVKEGAEETTSTTEQGDSSIAETTDEVKDESRTETTDEVQDEITSETENVIEESSEPSKEESSPSESDSDAAEETSESEEDTNEFLNFQYDMGMMPFAVSPYTDPFAYTPDGGKYPTHGTNNYNATQTDPDIKNYNYASTVDVVSGVPVKNILSGNLDFSKGYHSYKVGDSAAEEIYMKKIAMPTADPTKFKIQLDMIGGYLETRRNVDVVFVVDKSGSMEGSNWTALKAALGTFANGLLGSANNADGAVRLGLASFGGARVNDNWTAFGEIGNFSGSEGNYVGFTSSASTFLGHSILSVTPTGGTPTFLGLDAGLELLTNTAYNARADAEKVLVILTDGSPTYAPTGSYTGIRQTGNNTSNRMTRSTVSQGRIERFTAGSSLFTGDGSSTPPATRTAIINHANNRSATYSNIDRYSIGFNVSNVADILAALGPKGQYSATSQAELTTVMNLIRNKILDTSALIHDADVFDPMSSYVTLNGGTVKTVALQLNKSPRSLTTIASGAPSYPQYATDVVIDTSGNQIHLSNLTLSGDANKLNGFRVEYEVTLKEEYRDGKFYPTNGPTYLADDHYADPFGFAVPSVKHPVEKFNLPVEKIWNDENNKWHTRQNITLQLQKQEGTNWVNISGKTFSISKDATGNDLKSSFSDLPAYLNGSPINYRIVEVPDRVIGYKKAVYTPAVNVNATDKTLKVTNNLAYTPLGKFVKINEGNDQLQGVKFKLFRADGTTVVGTEKTSNANGEVDFSDTFLPVGTYLLKETTTLPGYVTMPNRTITVTDSGTTDVNLILSGMDDRPNEDGNQIVNKLKPFELKVTKQDNNGNALEGAEFTLTPNSGITVSLVGNVFTFKGLKPGTYTLTETKTPSGYIGIDPITIIVNSKGEVTIDSSTHPVDTTGESNLIELVVKNRATGILPTTGGPGTQQYVIATIILASLMGVVGIYYVYRNRKGAE